MIAPKRKSPPNASAENEPFLAIRLRLASLPENGGRSYRTVRFDRDCLRQAGAKRLPRLYLP
jgi:hypothetical protein